MTDPAEARARERSSVFTRENFLAALADFNTFGAITDASIHRRVVQEALRRAARPSHAGYRAGLEAAARMADGLRRKTIGHDVFSRGMESAFAEVAAAIRALPLPEEAGVELETTDESGWLIERADSSAAAPWYWAAGQRDAERSSAWTQNHMEAIRFARKDDAEKVARRLFKDIEVRICEHGWS